MLSVRAIYEGNNIHFFDQFSVEKDKPQFVIITFVDKIEKDISKYMIKYSVKTNKLDISNYEIQQLLTKGKSFDFLNAGEENIYSDQDHINDNMKIQMSSVAYKEWLCSDNDIYDDVFKDEIK